MIVEYEKKGSLHNIKKKKSKKITRKKSLLKYAVLKN